jgi:hypothetical protein
MTSDDIDPVPDSTGSATPDDTVTVEIAATADPDQAWKALSLVNEWIRHAEAKTGLTLAASGVVAGALYNLVKGQKDPNCFVSMLAFACGMALATSMVFAASALIPRQGKRSDDVSNLLYYSHIARQYRDDAPSYIEILSALTSAPDELTKHIAAQIHANAGVADRKFDFAGYAIIGLVVALACLGLLAMIIGKQ